MLNTQIDPEERGDLVIEVCGPTNKHVGHPWRDVASYTRQRLIEYLVMLGYSGKFQMKVMRHIAKGKQECFKVKAAMPDAVPPFLQLEVQPDGQSFKWRINLLAKDRNTDLVVLKNQLDEVMSRERNVARMKKRDEEEARGSEEVESDDQSEEVEGPKASSPQPADLEREARQVIADETYKGTILRSIAERIISDGSVSERSLERELMLEVMAEDIKGTGIQSHIEVAGIVLRNMFQLDYITMLQGTSMIAFSQKAIDFLANARALPEQLSASQEPEPIVEPPVPKQPSEPVFTLTQLEEMVKRAKSRSYRRKDAQNKRPGILKKLDDERRALERLDSSRRDQVAKIATLEAELAGVDQVLGESEGGEDEALLDRLRRLQ